MDPKLKLKPVEILDIGIDKLTKIPVPIYNDNVVSTYDMENNLPTDTISFTFDSNYSNNTFGITLTTNYETKLYFNYGDGNTSEATINGTSYLPYTYTSFSIYTITISGWLNKLTDIILLPLPSSDGGLLSINIRNARKLNNLNLSGNLLTSIDISGLIYLNNIDLSNNYLTNDEIDDIYINADTTVKYTGSIDTTGTNNGTPSVYSSYARSSLLSKSWTLNYNT